MVAVPPIAFECGIEHLAEPVDDHRLLHLAENAAIDLGVVVAAARRLHQRAACHQHDAPAEFFDRGALLLVGADDVVEGHVGARFEMIGAGAAADQRAGKILGGVEAPADQFERGRPVDAHAALGGVHGLGDAEPERPQVPAECDGALPVDRGIEPGVAIGQRIGDDMRGRVGDAAERRLRRGQMARRLGGVGRKLAAGDRKIERGHVSSSLRSRLFRCSRARPHAERANRSADMHGIIPSSAALR